MTLESRHLLAQQLLSLLHVRNHLLHVSVLRHHLLHHGVLLLLEHELLGLKLLLLLVLVHQLFVVVIYLVALLLGDVDVRVLLEYLRKLFDFHVLIQQWLLLLLILLHLLRRELLLAIDLRHCHAVVLKLLGEVLLLHFAVVSDLLAGHGLGLRPLLGHLRLLGLHLALQV